MHRTACQGTVGGEQNPQREEERDQEPEVGVEAGGEGERGSDKEEPT